MKHSHLQYMTENEQRILERLALYTYLTSNQFVQLGICRQRNNLYPLLGGLKQGKKAYIKEFVYPPHPVHGRLASLYYLSYSGVKFLREHLGLEEHEIRYPRRKMEVCTDYFHRVSTIDFHIRFRQWAELRGYNIPVFDTYFNTTYFNTCTSNSGKSETATKVMIAEDEYIIPDGIGYFEGKHGNLFCLEIHNGKDAKRIVKQLHQYIRALESGGVSEKYHVNIGCQVVVLFQEPSCMEATMKYCSNDDRFAPLKDYFIFGALESFMANDVNTFDTGWKLFDGTEVRFV